MLNGLFPSLTLFFSVAIQSPLASLSEHSIPLPFVLTWGAKRLRALCISVGDGDTILTAFGFRGEAVGRLVRSRLRLAPRGAVPKEMKDDHNQLAVQEKEVDVQNENGSEEKQIKKFSRSKSGSHVRSRGGGRGDWPQRDRGCQSERPASLLLVLAALAWPTSFWRRLHKYITS